MEKAANSDSRALKFSPFCDFKKSCKMTRSERIYGMYRKLKILCQGVKNSFLDYIDSHHVSGTILRDHFDKIKK